MITRFARPQIDDLAREQWPAGLLEELPAGMAVPHSLEIRVAGLPTVLHTLENHDLKTKIKRWELSCAVRLGQTSTAYLFKSSTRFVHGDTEDEVSAEFMQTVLMYTITCVESLMEEEG